MRRIDKLSAQSFLDANHRLHYCKARYYYALFVERCTGKNETKLEKGTMVAIALFSSARRWEKNGRIISSYEWIRYASLQGIRVVGGMSKLLQTFIDEVKPDDIMSYADINSEDKGESYLKLGFTKEGIVEKENFRNIKFRLTL